MRYIEWLIRRGPDPEMVLYEVLPYAPAQADRIIAHLCAVADGGRGGRGGPAWRTGRQAFGFIVDAARTRQALLDLNTIERGIGRSPGTTC